MTGKPVASAIRNVLALQLEGKVKNANRQPSGCRQRPDEAQHRMHPIADAARPSDRYAGQEADRGADHIAAELQLDRRKDADQQLRQIVGIDFDDGLRRRKERQRQPREFGGRDFPHGQEQPERQQPWRARLQPGPEAAEQGRKCRIPPPITNAAIATACVRDQSPRSSHSRQDSPKPTQATLASAPPMHFSQPTPGTTADVLQMPRPPRPIAAAPPP